MARTEGVKLRTFTWTFDLKDLDGEKGKKGASICSPKFKKMCVPDMHLEFYPYGNTNSPDGKSALFLHAPSGWNLEYRLRAGGAVHHMQKLFDKNGWGTVTVFPVVTSFSTHEVSVELLKAVPPQSTADAKPAVA